MKFLKHFFATVGVIASIAVGSYYLSTGAAPDLTVTPIHGLPPTVVESTTLAGLTYNVHNNSVGTINVTFSELNGDGISYTTTCGALAASSDCTLTLAFDVPAIPAGQPFYLYIHPFKVVGGTTPLIYPLSTKIIPGGTDVSAKANISFTGGDCTGKTFTVTLTPSIGSATEFDDVPCGLSTLSPALPQGQYTASIAPATDTVGDDTFDAPAAFPFHLANTGDTANFPYTLNQDIAVDTVVTAPNIGSNTPQISCTGPATYAHDVTAGTNPFDNMKPGQYTCTAANYTGTDTETYTPAISNPVTVDNTHTVITITYSALPPASTAVSTVLTTPNLPTGNTVSCTLHDADNTYTHNQPTGTAHFDQVVDASDYTFSCIPYTVGSDTYSMTTQTNVVIDSSHTTLTGVFSKNAPPGSSYNWHPPHISATISANMFAVWIGGGSTTSVIQISSNPIPDDPLKAMVEAYELSPIAIQPTAYVQNFPHTLSIGTIGEDTSAVTDQLKTIKLQSAFHYEGDGSGDRGHFWDAPGGYTPQVDALAAQEAAVKTATGNQMVNGTAFYTIDYSDGAYAILQDTENDTNVIAHQYNLMYEAYRMQYQYTQGNPMVILMNPDATEPFQNCGTYNCATAWKPGIFQSGGHVVAIPNLQADTFAAIDRMVSKGYLSSGAGAAMKADFTTHTIGTPPPDSGRCPKGVCTPGLPELVLSNSWIIRYLAPNVSFGYGNNEYDSSNALLVPTGTNKCETASFEWLHCVQHQGWTQDQINTTIQFEAQKYANYLKDMNLVGNEAGNYKPDFLYFDRYERDVSPAYVSSGFLMNGVDWDLYTYYIAQIDALIGDMPWAYWQMGGATLHVQPTWYERVWTSIKHLFVSHVDHKPWHPMSTPKTHANAIKLKSGDTAAVNVTLGAPGLGSTVSITMQDWDPAHPQPPSPFVPHTYTHNVAPGTSLYDNMYYAPGEWQHNYWLVGANYTASGHTYWPQCNNPYGISNNVPSFSINYAYAVALLTTSWTPDVGSNTPSVTIQGGCYGYTGNLTPGSAQSFLSAVVPGTYTAVGASYVGSGDVTYFLITQNPYVVTQTGTADMFVAYGRLGDTFGNWFFGSPELNNDFSNSELGQSFVYVPFTPTMNNSVYYTKNSNVQNEIDYLKLTSASP